jgi:REP element-mobilizing transposase RayT
MSHSLAKLLVHVIFSTRDRVAFLSDETIRRQVHARLETVFRKHESPVIIVGGTADHVHVFCSLSRSQPLSRVIGEAKRLSSRWLKRQGGEMKAFQWQEGYGAFSVHQSQAMKVREYITDQEEYHHKRTFQEEFRDFLNRYEVDYDERYLWD